MKISVQEKIAELEARIAALEQGRTTTTTTTRTVSMRTKGPFGEHWDKMWEHFDKIMDNAFR